MPIPSSKNTQRNIASILLGCFLWYHFCAGLSLPLKHVGSSFHFCSLFDGTSFPMAEVWVMGLSFRAVCVTDRRNCLELPTFPQRQRVPPPCLPYFSQSVIRFMFYFHFLWRFHLHNGVLCYKKIFRTASIEPPDVPRRIWIHWWKCLSLTLKTTPTNVKKYLHGLWFIGFNIKISFKF